MQELTQRQGEIINFSIEIIGEKGIQALTIKNIAQKLGVSEPAIYRHFKSKTAILLAILDTFEELFEFISDSLATQEISTLEKIEFIFSRITAIFVASPAYVSVIFSEELFKNEESLQSKINSLMETKARVINEIIADGQKTEEIRRDIEAETLALMVMGSLRLLVKQWDLKNQRDTIEQDSKKLINALALVLTK